MTMEARAKSLQHSCHTSGGVVCVCGVWGGGGGPGSRLFCHTLVCTIKECDTHVLE